MTRGPVLGLVDVTKPFEVETDASDFALGGVLIQEGHPIAYESRKLNIAERSYTVSEKEMLAVVHCLRVWRQYLLGSRFVVKTDNSAICHFFNQPKLTSKQARWKESLAEFDFKFEHKAGKTRQFWVEGDLLLTKGNRLYVPRAGDLRRKLLHECHDTLWAGHPGWQRTYALLKKGYFWPNMRDDVMQYTKTCLICQQDKVEKAKVSGLLSLSLLVEHILPSPYPLWSYSLRPDPFVIVSSPLSLTGEYSLFHILSPYSLPIFDPLSPQQATAERASAKAVAR